MRPSWLVTSDAKGDPSLTLGMTGGWTLGMTVGWTLGMTRSSSLDARDLGEARRPGPHIESELPLASVSGVELRCVFACS